MGVRLSTLTGGVELGVWQLSCHLRNTIAITTFWSCEGFFILHLLNRLVCMLLALLCAHTMNFSFYVLANELLLCSIIIYVYAYDM